MTTTETTSAVDLPFASSRGKLWLCLRRSVKDTRNVFAFEPKTLVWIALTYLIWVLLSLPTLLTLAWSDLLTQLLPADLNVLLVAGAVVLALFIFNFGCAPYRIVREENDELHARLAHVEKQTSPLVEIGYDPGDCNSKQGSGVVSLTLGGKWQRVNLANLHVLRLRCSNPTSQDIRDCSGHITAVERSTPEGSWETIWHDALDLVWSLTEGETHTTIPAKGSKYLDVAVLSANDLPVLKAKAPPFDLHDLFHQNGLYRLRGCVSSEARTATEFEMTLEYEVVTQRVVVTMQETPPQRRFPKVSVAARALSQTGHPYNLATGS